MVRRWPASSVGLADSGSALRDTLGQVGWGRPGPQSQSPASPIKHFPQMKCARNPPWESTRLQAGGQELACMYFMSVSSTERGIQQALNKHLLKNGILNSKEKMQKKRWGHHSPPPIFLLCSHRLFSLLSFETTFKERTGAEGETENELGVGAGGTLEVTEHSNATTRLFDTETTEALSIT